MDNDRFARTIKNARLKKGYTQSQLADLLNVSNKTISKWETGRGYPDITLLAKITSILKLDYEELLQSNEYIIQKRKNYYVGDQLALAYREPASLVVMYSGGLTQKKVIQFCDYLNINDFKKIKTIKTEFSNNPTISYINQDNQEKQYEFYIMSQKGDIKVTIVILKNNIIKILDDENHQVHYYQSQNINYEKLNIDHLPW